MITIADYVEKEKNDIVRQLNDDKELSNVSTLALQQQLSDPDKIYKMAVGRKKDEINSFLDLYYSSPTFDPKSQYPVKFEQDLLAFGIKTDDSVYETFMNSTSSDYMKIRQLLVSGSGMTSISFPTKYDVIQANQAGIINSDLELESGYRVVGENVERFSIADIYWQRELKQARSLIANNMVDEMASGNLGIDGQSIEQNITENTNTHTMGFSMFQTMGFMASLATIGLAVFGTVFYFMTR